MKRAYTQLTEKERQEIARTRLLGWSSHASGRWWPRAHLRALGCRSLTVDNGMGLASHQALATAVGAPVYFAAPGCPWQRGTNEHHHGLLRWWLPKGTDIGTVSAAQRHQIMHALNDRPRKQLGWRTPAEKMAELFRARAAPLGGIAVIKEFIDY